MRRGRVRRRTSGASRSRRPSRILPRLIGAISPADPNAIEVVDGAVRLTVSVSTNSELTAATEGWGKAKVGHAETEHDGTVTLTVPAPAERGFFILKSKPTTVDVQRD